MKIINGVITSLLCLIASASNDATQERNPQIDFPQRTLTLWRSSYNQEGAWIEGPFGNLYQFHIGDQSWLSAREHCLALDSDLVIIHSFEQLEWIVSHYPLHRELPSDRIVQIGLIYNDSDRDWRWVDGSAFNASFLQLRKNGAVDVNESETEGRCAMLRLNELRIDSVRCEAAASFDRTNRFICERTQKRHFKHLQSSFPIWREFEQIVRLLRFANAVPHETTTISATPGLNKTDEEATATAADRTIDANETERNLSSAQKKTAFLTSLSDNMEEDDCLLCANSTNLSSTGLSKAVNGSESSSGTEMELTQTHQDEQAENPKWMIDSLHEEETKTNEEGEKTVYKHVIIMEYNGTLISDENNEAQKQKQLEHENKTLKNDLHKNKNSTRSVSGEKTDEAFDSPERPFAKASEQIIKTTEDEIAESGKMAVAISDMKKAGFEEKDEQRNNGDTVDDGFAEDFNVARRFEEDFIDGSRDDASDKMRHQFCEDELKEPTPRSRDEKISEFLVALSEFLKRVGHKELRELLDNNSTGVTLTERLKEAVAMKNDKEFHKLKDAFAKKKKNEEGRLKQLAVAELQQRHHHRLPPTKNSAASEVEDIAVTILSSVDKLLQLQMQFPDENLTNGYHQQDAHLEQNLTYTAEMLEGGELNNVGSHEIKFDNVSAPAKKNDKSKVHLLFNEVDGLDNNHEKLSNNGTKDARKQSNDELDDDILGSNATLLLSSNSSEQAESQRSVAPDDSTHGYAEVKRQDSSISSIKLSRLSNSFQIPSGITWNGVNDRKYHSASENSVDDSLTPGMEIIQQNLSDRIKKLLTEKSLP